MTAEKPVRVLHVIGVMDRGGAETLIMNLYRETDRDRVQFDFVESNSGEAVFDHEIEELGGRIYHCPRFTVKNLPAYVKWWNAFFDEHEGEYEVIHGHIGSSAAVYLEIAKKHGLYTIAHSHGRYGPLTVSGAMYRAVSFPTRFIADHFFACSAEAGMDRYGKRTAGSGKMSILNNAIDTDHFRYSEEAGEKIRDELNIAEGTRVIGHTGRFVEAKNHDFLIDIFQKIHEKNPDTVLVMVGDGELRESIETKVRSLKLEEAVRFTGLQSNVSDYMSAMDVLVFPSLHEGLPVTLVEAQASGLPCVISDCIPADAHLVSELIHTCSLEENPAVWADEALRVKTDDRKKYADLVKDAGFDAKASAQELTEFYLAHSNEIRENGGTKL